MDPTIAIVALLVVFAIFYAIYRSYTRISIAHIPGPEPESFLLGIDFLHYYLRHIFITSHHREFARVIPRSSRRGNQPFLDVILCGYC